MAVESPYACASSTTVSASSRPRPLWRSARFWVPAIVCLLAVLAVPLAFIAGAVVGTSQVYTSFASHQQSRIEAFLAEDPDAFGELTVEHASNGWAYPMGMVNTQEDYDRLSRRLHKMFGDELAEDMMSTVGVRSIPSGDSRVLLRDES